MISMVSGSFLRIELQFVIIYFFVLLPTGATACVELKRFEEAITWRDKGLAVSFEGIFHF